MCLSIALSLLLTLPAVQDAPSTERTIDLASGGQLEVNPINKGSVTISGWDREQVSIKAFHSPRIHFEIQASKRGVKVEERRPVRSALEDVRLEIFVPRETRIQVIGRIPRVEVRGVEGSIFVNTNQGDIFVSRAKGSIRLSSSGGKLRLEEVNGTVQLNTTSQGIVVDGLMGSLEAETVSGDIALSGVRSNRVRATSHQGGISFQGRLDQGGLYDFATDKGSLDLILEQPVDATFTVGTVSGDFQCDFPLGGVVPKKGERFTFSVGEGGAQIELLTFQGPIRIRRR